MLPTLVILTILGCVMPTLAVGIPTFMAGTPLCIWELYSACVVGNTSLSTNDGKLNLHH